MVAALFAVDPQGTGGVCVRSPPQPLRDEWLSLLRESLPAAAPLRRIPCSIPDGRLLGGLDLTATLRTGRPMAERGVLAEASGGVIVVAMAERLSSHTAALLSDAQESGEIQLARDGVSLRIDTCVGVVALDESMSEEEHIGAALLDRMAFLLDFNGFGARARLTPLFTRGEIAQGRQLLPAVRAGDEILNALCAAALALGAGSPRVSCLALRAARACAALGGREVVSEDDAILAGRLVLAPRAAALPESTPPASTPPDSGDARAEPDSDGAEAENDGPSRISAQDLEDIVLAAAQASIPEGLLEKIRRNRGQPAKSADGRGRAGALRSSENRGRPCGVRRGSPRGRARMNLIETLRAAAPWQRLRGQGALDGPRIRVAPEDFRVTRYKQRSRTLTIFAVDASGSAALNRLAEAKGAVELLLADCYIRRDQVAVIAFRGRTAELLLPPTRSLVRAKRSLAGLPGGGGTPLASAIASALMLAGSIATARRDADSGDVDGWPRQRRPRRRARPRIGPEPSAGGVARGRSSAHRGAIYRYLAAAQSLRPATRGRNAGAVHPPAACECTVALGDRRAGRF